MRNYHMKSIIKLLLSGGITLCSGCQSENTFFETTVADDWYKDYTSDDIHRMDFQILNENPFYAGQSKEEKLYYLEKLALENPTLSELQKYWMLDLKDFIVEILEKNPEEIFEVLNQLQVENANIHVESLNGAYANHFILLDNTLGDKEEAVFKHELIHALSKKIYDHKEELQYFEEGLASIIGNEFSGTPNNTYLNTAAMIKILIELVGVEPFYDMMTTGNIDSLKDAIYMIDSNFDVSSLLSSIDTIYQRESRIHDNQEIVEEYISNIEYLYQLKYHTSIYENDAIVNYIQFLNKETVSYQENDCYVCLDNCYFNQNGYRIFVFYDENYQLTGVQSLESWRNGKTYTYS